MFQLELVCCSLLVTVVSFPVTGPEISECINNSGALPLAARVLGCPGVPCALPQLDDIPIHIIFRALRDTKTMNTTATAFFSFGAMQLPVPYDLGEKSVTCNYLVNSTCPVKKDALILYTLDFFVDPVFPIGTGTSIEFTIWGDSGEAITCIRVALTVQSPVPLVMQRKNNAFSFKSRANVTKNLKTSKLLSS